MRIFRHSSGFALVSVAMLAAGIGLAVAMFSTYSRVVLNPVTMREPATLVSLFSVNRHGHVVPATLSWPRFEVIREASTHFHSLGAYSVDSVNMTTADGPALQLRALRVSGDFFGTLGVEAASGRLFQRAEDVVNGPAVCVLSHALWMSRFGGREMVGQNIQLNGQPVEVVGILPPDFGRPWTERQIFLPRVFEDSGIARQSIMNGATFIEVVGRLRSGATIEQAATELRRTSEHYAQRFGARADAQNDVDVRPFVETVVGRHGPVMTGLLGAVAAVLLIACTNVAAMFLSRLASRHRETAVRLALGASRTIIIRQFMAESLALAAMAGVLGLAVAAGVLRVTQVMFASDLPVGTELAIDRGALVVTLALVLLVTILVGLAPALQVTNPRATSHVASVERGSSGSPGAGRLRALLVVTQTVLSVVLLVAAALLLTSLSRLRHTAIGFDPNGVAAAFTNLTAPRYAPPDRQTAYFLDVIDHIRRSPLVSGAAVVFGLPFHDENYAHTYVVAGQPIPPAADRRRAGLRSVSEDYFAVMGIRLIEGRAFTVDDRPGGPGVCIVNESLARRVSSGESVLGRVLLRGLNADRTCEVVGVIADVKTNGPRDATPDEIFYPFRQMPRANAAIVARTRGDASALAPVFDDAAMAVDREQPVSRFAPMMQRLGGEVGVERVMAVITAMFAALALLLASIGLYAVLAHGVATRRAEIAIRMAMGAERSTILRLILSHGMRLTALGTGLGLLVALAMSGLLASHLFGIDARTPGVYILVAGVFTAVGVLASLAPALRATSVDPLVALRQS
jgi:predicted permease